MIKAILAIDENNAIGNKNQLPWPYISEDMKYFSKHTTDSVVVMGSETFKSLGRINLKNRFNIVLTSKIFDYPDAHQPTCVMDLEEYLETLDEIYVEDIWIIGGKSIYEQTLKYCEEIYVTKIKGSYKADTYFDIENYLTDHVLVSSKNSTKCDFEIWGK